ncbi:hypothetical protein BLA28_09210 [Eisenbergiella tayi]|nr:hypothetical protein BLA28_09210 [Eisenbergiella tayi]
MNHKRKTWRGLRSRYMFSFLYVGTFICVHIYMCSQGEDKKPDTNRVQICIVFSLFLCYDNCTSAIAILFYSWNSLFRLIPFCFC